MTGVSLRSRRLRAWIVLLWLILAVVVIAGLVVAFTVSRTAGIVLFGVGAVGYLTLGAIVFMFMPRRG
ncbi:MAG TPA: hypothetical protein VG268_16335 [Streptosporangiaceae bacterium]|nr:hypothetical protein [Streptosporangiaceae bacterium]